MTRRAVFTQYRACNSCNYFEYFQLQQTVISFKIIAVYLSKLLQLASETSSYLRLHRGWITIVKLTTKKMCKLVSLVFAIKRHY